MKCFDPTLQITDLDANVLDDLRGTTILLVQTLVSKLDLRCRMIIPVENWCLKTCLVSG